MRRDNLKIVNFHILGLNNKLFKKRVIAEAYILLIVLKI